MFFPLESARFCDATRVNKQFVTFEFSAKNPSRRGAAILNTDRARPVNPNFINRATGTVSQRDCLRAPNQNQDSLPLSECHE